MPKNTQLHNLLVERGETEKHVNFHVLKFILSKFDKASSIKVLDLPCGSSMLFLGYLQSLFKRALLKGADIVEVEPPAGIQFIKMDLSKDFTLSTGEKFDLITSISGVMMFGNTLSFIGNCAKRLHPNGTFIITNDNSATLLDKLYFLFLGRHRLFKPFYSNFEPGGIIQNVSVSELCGILKTSGFEIEDIQYTSSYWKHFFLMPIAILIYPVQLMYLWQYKTKSFSGLKWKMYPFKHLFCKHYIIIAGKV